MRLFLYYEEMLLHQGCQRVSLREIHLESIYIFHKEGRSSKLLFGNKTYGTVGELLYQNFEIHGIEKQVAG